MIISIFRKDNRRCFQWRIQREAAASPVSPGLPVFQGHPLLRNMDAASVKVDGRQIDLPYLSIRLHDMVFPSSV